MAKHRLRPTTLTQHGHELWGALGCNLSHQYVLQRLEEDDATLGMTAGMRAARASQEIHSHHHM